MKVGIIGAGRIATKMAKAITNMEGVEKYAIASRDIEKAKDFADRCQINQAYGSYKKLVEDPDVDLVYIATPHSHHYEHAMLAIEAGKPVLCEKAFTANAREADSLLNLAHRKGVFITEAMITRYLPLSQTIREVLDSGIIGTPAILSATLSYSLAWKERVMRSSLCGGALLDIGIYCIHFARICFGTDIEKVTSACIRGGDDMVDMHESISFIYRNGRLANLQASALGMDDRRALISGENGFLTIDNVNCPTKLTVWKDYEPIKEYSTEDNQFTGLRYEVAACKDALKHGWIESPQMPHVETLAIMKQMDALRKEWGVIYPNDRIWK